MNSFLIRLYGWLLQLYPREFRDEFADEMRRVFADSLADASQRGTMAIVHVWLKELRDLPRAILREHWQARSKSTMENKTRISPLELATIAIPFLLYLAIAITEIVQIFWAGPLMLILFGVLVILLIVCLFKGMTRWSLPMFGLLFGILNWIGFSLWSPILDSLGPPPPLIRGIYSAGLTHIGILVLTLVIVLTIASIKPMRPIFHKIQQDYTLLPLMLYGIMPIEILIGFDDYQNEGPYKVGMTLVLLACLWLYLQSTQLKRKLFWLGIGITLAMAVEAIGKWILVPSQDWPIWFQWHTIEQAQQIEVTATIWGWFWIMIVVFLPALLGLLPHEKQPVATSLV